MRRRETPEQEKARWREEFSRHELTLLCGDQWYTAIWLLRKPGTSVYSVHICFTPAGIVLTGDVMFGDSRAVATYPGYGVEWFASTLSPDYLAEKFLTKGWTQDRAREDAAWLAREARGAGMRNEAKDWISAGHCARQCSDAREFEERLIPWRSSD